MNLYEYSELSFQQFLSMDSSLKKLTLSEQHKRYNNYLLEVSILQQQQQTMVNSVTSGQGAAQVEVSGSDGGGGIAPAPSPVFAPSVTPSITVTPSVTVTPSISVSALAPSPTPTPTPSPSPVVGRLNGIRILGSGNYITSTTTNAIISDITALGYAAPTIITSSLAGNTYTGADLDPAFDDIVIVAPGYWAQAATFNVGAPELANNLKTYLNNGGKVMWVTYFTSHPLGGPSGSFDFAITPYSASGASTGVQLGGTPGNIIFETAGVGHPITNGVTANTNLTVNLNSAFNNFKTAINTRPGATPIISIGNPANITNANRYALVQTMTYAGNRVSMFNNAVFESLTSANTNAVSRRIVANTILWTAGMI